MSEEREFLHSMANHLAVAWAAIETVMDQGDVQELGRAMHALEKMKESLDRRRAAYPAKETKD